MTFSDIGRHLDVVPRHVAYILANLGTPHDQEVPWHRAVPDGASLKTQKCDSLGHSQAELLQADGVPISADGMIEDMERRLCQVADLPHGICQQSRPAQTFVNRRRRRSAAVGA